MKVMVLGGYGNFGARISRALAGNAGIELLVAGRSEAKAEGFAQNLTGARGVAVDWSATGFVDHLRAWNVGLVIHSAGPFQGQGYGVARASAAAGAHYIDLADGRRFVCDFPVHMDASFKAAGCVGITGASTVPALSSAVVEALTLGWAQLDAVDICIAPAQTAPRGVATLEAVLSYCGKSVPVWQEGRWQERIGWAELQRVEFLRLKPRVGAICDIPDLELFPKRYGVRDRVVFRAALEVSLTQRALALLARLRRAGVWPRPDKLARMLNAGAPVFDRWGSALGGMVVRVAGLNENCQLDHKAWHIAADHDHGPEIPCMAAIVLARRLAQGEAMPAGARACVGLHQLGEFAPEFAKWGMVTDIVRGA
ncbi:MAG: saccharopine dehydrogenase [Burkholderiales bacterium PBB4]|nr:MAG: saccharopine dehydrogenase [Burkholderiales bacterium PBB4]